MNDNMTPLVPTTDDLIGFISDTYKEINGFRPRPNWSELSYEQLDKWGRELSAEVVIYRSYFIPTTFTLGSFVKD